MLVRIATARVSRVSQAGNYFQGEKVRYLGHARAALLLALQMCCLQISHADMRAADDFLRNEISGQSVLSGIEQRAEMRWFVDAAKPFNGITIKVLSDDSATQRYVSKVLAPAFESMTGIRVLHDSVDAAAVAETLQRQTQSGENNYDAYVADSDLLGTLWRYRQTRDLNQWMQSDAQEQTLPTLDISDFLGTAFVTTPDGELLQLTDQQSASLYWFRHDWFSDEQIQSDFLARFGYELGVPQNWQAYEDIAEFFTGREVDGQRVYGHMEVAEKNLFQGGRFANTWLASAGNGDIQEADSVASVDSWGVRVNENGQALGACVQRGGSVNSPAATYALGKYADWLADYAPPQANDMSFESAYTLLNQDLVAQQLFWPSAQTPRLKVGSVLDETSDGSPQWRMAPGPVGAFWQIGKQRGYQKVSGWTLLKSTPDNNAKAAWLYAQFAVSKTVDLKRSHAGLTFIRKSTIDDQSFTIRAKELGGLVEFYRSPLRQQWSPASVNVPDYLKLSEKWWPTLLDVSSGAVPANQALDELCASQEIAMARIQRAGVQGPLGPVLHEERGAAYWFARAGAPEATVPNEKPIASTIRYDSLISNQLSQ